MPTATQAMARLEARINPELHSLFKRAAELQGRTMTDFVVSAAREAANKVIQETEIITLSIKDQECFVQALLNPVEPGSGLRKAFANRKRLFGK